MRLLPSHNRAMDMEKLRRILKQKKGVAKPLPRGRPRFAVGMVREKDDQLMIEKIREIAAHFKPPNPSKSARHQEIMAGPENNQSLIQWPSDEQIVEVCDRLMKLKNIGIKYEHKGDYFNSGELAYQIRDIIRTTWELFQKSQRLGKKNS